ncbi:MAG TPA: cohesin domain-containing protein, partial [Bryobacteraceae bacterium]
ADVSAVPMVLHFDPARLSLINVDSGTFLNADGQAAAVIHRDDGQGNLTIVASRPPGTTGVSGGGVVCVLTFQAKSAGQSTISMSRASVTTSTQQTVPAQGQAQANVVIR